MKRFLPWVLVAVLILVYGGQCRSLGDVERQREIDRVAHAKETAEIAQQLALARQHRDTVVRRVPVERVRIVHDSVRVAVIETHVPAADSSGDSLRMIRVRDTLIGEQQTEIGDLRLHVATLSELAASDSGVIRLFQAQRIEDSTYIKRLELRARGFRIAGIQFPKAKCGVGGGVTHGIAEDGKRHTVMGATASCILTF